MELGSSTPDLPERGEVGRCCANGLPLAVGRPRTLRIVRVGTGCIHHALTVIPFMAYALIIVESCDR
jgi:hypothetical protein